LYKIQTKVLLQWTYNFRTKTCTTAPGNANETRFSGKYSVNCKQSKLLNSKVLQTGACLMLLPSFYLAMDP